MIPTPQSSASADTDKQREMRDEHQQYQHALQQHIILHRAWKQGRFDAEMERFYREIEQDAPEGHPYSPDRITAAMVMRSFVDPHARFPDIAGEVIQEGNEIAVDHLQWVCDPSRNSQLKLASQGSQAEMRRIINDPSFVDSLKFDLLHEKTFGPAEGADGGTLEERLERWVEVGMEADVATNARRGANAGLLALGGLPAVAGMGITYAIKHGYPALCKLSWRALEKACSVVTRNRGLSNEEGRALMERLDRKVATRLAKNTLGGGVVFLASAGLLGINAYAAGNWPGLGQEVLEVFNALEHGSEEVIEAMKGGMPGWVGSWLDGSLARDWLGEFLNLPADHGAGQANKQASEIQVGLVTAFVSALTSAVHHRFTFTAGTPFRRDPLGDMDGAAERNAYLGSMRHVASHLVTLNDEARAEGALAWWSNRGDAGAGQIKEACRRIAGFHARFLEKHDLTRLSVTQPAERVHLLDDLNDPERVMALISEAAGVRRGAQGRWERDLTPEAAQQRRVMADRLRDLADCVYGESLPAPREKGREASLSSTASVPSPGRPQTPGPF